MCDSLCPTFYTNQLLKTVVWATCCVMLGARFRKYVGHSAHVTNVRFSHDKRRLLSTGGADHAVFQWRFFGESMPLEDSQGKYTGACCLLQVLSKVFTVGLGDSANEESDSDLSDIPEADSDVEQEQQIKYDRAVYKEDLATLEAKMSRTKKDETTQEARKQTEKRHRAPPKSLQLEFVHGYDVSVVAALCLIS